MKNKIINITKGLFGYLFFVFIVTIMINAQENEEAEKHIYKLITLTEFIVNCIAFGSMIGIIGLIIVFTEDRKYNFKLTLLYFVLLFISCLYIAAPQGITNLEHIPHDLFQNAIAYFFIFSFISFFILLKIFTNKK